MGDVGNKAKAGWLRHSRSAFSVDGGVTKNILLENSQGQQVSIAGIYTRHSINFDTDGNVVNSPNIHMSFHEEEFNAEVIAQGVSFKEIRNQDVISLQGFFAYFADSSGTVFKYKVQEYWPDTTVGMIVCMCEVTEKTTFNSLKDVCN